MKNDAMKNDNASERAVALMNEAVDVLQRCERAPASPVKTFLRAELRRELRRRARRLRLDQAEPRYINLHSAEELAGIYERTIERDEILEQGQRDFRRIARELKRIRAEKDPEFEKTMVTLVREAARSAEEDGPGSEAAGRYRLLCYLGWCGLQARVQRRKPRAPFSWALPLLGDPATEARYTLSAAEVLDSPPPPDEAVIVIPPEDRDSGRRVFMRIGFGEASWIGSFEIGHANVGSVSMMPDDKHLFVSAKGAGYIIDATSRTLVEQIGMDVAGVMMHVRRTLFVVDHNGTRLEAFGKRGRLWKTGIISCGGFREIAFTDTCLIGEARRPSLRQWTAFSVELATGEVGFADTR